MAPKATYVITATGNSLVTLSDEARVTITVAAAAPGG